MVGNNYSIYIYIQRERERERERESQRQTETDRKKGNIETAEAVKTIRTWSLSVVNLLSLFKPVRHSS